MPFSEFGLGAPVPPSNASPQSLFRKSPEEYMARMGQVSDDYFPVTPPPPPPPSDLEGSPTTESTIGSVTMPNTAAAEKQKPLLLLVEDNEINLQVCIFPVPFCVFSAQG